MQKAAPAGTGAMAALLGLELAQVEEIAQKASEKEICAVANDNSPGQVVLSGARDAVHRAMEIAKESGARRVVLLPVSAPFHSSLMAPAAVTMKEALETVDFSEPCTGFIANVSASPLKEVSDIKKSLVTQVTGRVRWRESVLFLKEKGVKTIVEIGAGKVLSGLTKRIDSDIQSVAINGPEDIEKVMELI